MAATGRGQGTPAHIDNACYGWPRLNRMRRCSSSPVPRLDVAVAGRTRFSGGGDRWSSFIDRHYWTRFSVVDDGNGHASQLIFGNSRDSSTALLRRLSDRPGRLVACRSLVDVVFFARQSFLFRTHLDTHFRRPVLSALAHRHRRDVHAPVDDKHESFDGDSECRLNDSECRLNDSASRRNDSASRPNDSERHGNDGEPRDNDSRYASE